MSVHKPVQLSMEPTGPKDILEQLDFSVMSKACERIRVKSAAENRMVCVQDVTRMVLCHLWDIKDNTLEIFVPVNQRSCY